MKKRIKLKEVIQSLEYVKGQYAKLSKEIAEQINNDEIVEATNNIEKLRDLREFISKLENVSVDADEFADVWKEIT